MCIWGQCRKNWEECEQETWVTIGHAGGDGGDDGDGDDDINKQRVRFVKRRANSHSTSPRAPTSPSQRQTRLTCLITGDFLTTQEFQYPYEDNDPMARALFSLIALCVASYYL